MKLDEFYDNLTKNQSPYIDWIKEIDSMSKEERIKLVPKMRELVIQSIEDRMRIERGLPRLYGDALERSIVYNEYMLAKIGEE